MTRTSDDIDAFYPAQAFRVRPNRVVISAPSQQVDLKQHNVLQVGDKKAHPSHIPDHLPDFPDTHTYWYVTSLLIAGPENVPRGVMKYRRRGV